MQRAVWLFGLRLPGTGDCLDSNPTYHVQAAHFEPATPLLQALDCASVKWGDYEYLMHVLVEGLKEVTDVTFTHAHHTVRSP